MERLTDETVHGTFAVNGRGKVRPQQRGWTPASLSLALAGHGIEISRWTLWRSAERGEIPHTRTPGGHVRIDAQWVTQTFPQLAVADRDAA